MVRCGEMKFGKAEERRRRGGRGAGEVVGKVAAVSAAAKRHHGRSPLIHNFPPTWKDWDDCCNLFHGDWLDIGKSHLVQALTNGK